MNKTVFIGMIASAIILGSAACKIFEDTIPVPVELQFDIYNHTQGYLTQFIKGADGSLMSGDTVTLTISKLINNYRLRDVDDKRIALYHDSLSEQIAFDNDGDASLRAPRENTSYDIVLFNSLPKPVSYQWMDEQGSHLYRETRNYIVFRKDYDGMTGPEEVWRNVFDQLNSALDLGWVKWGSIARKPAPNDGQGDFSYGYGICIWQGERVDGVHESYRIIMDSERLQIHWVRLAIGLEEAFENICFLDDIGGQNTYLVIQDQGVLNQVGKDLFAYVFVKDKASMSPGSKFGFSIGIH